MQGYIYCLCMHRCRGLRLAYIETRCMRAEALYYIGLAYYSIIPCRIVGALQGGGLYCHPGSIIVAL